jgi:hypothetical protein
MELYDIAVSSYVALDSDALVSLTKLFNSSLDSSFLQARADALRKGIATTLLDPSTKLYTNRLYNGSFYPRLSPTSFAPFLARVPSSNATVAAALALLASPAGFCVDASHGANLRLLTRFTASENGFAPSKASASCASTACLQRVMLDVYDFAQVEGMVLTTDPGNHTFERLHWYISESTSTHALATPAAAAAHLGSAYQKVAGDAEGICWPDVEAGHVALSLWQHSSQLTFMTCATESCVDEAMSGGYIMLEPSMCSVLPLLSVADAPCHVPLPSISRSDPSFLDNLYWRGRVWAPQIFLTHTALLTEGSAASKAAAATLRVMAGALFDQQWSLFAQINENTNGLLGVGSDSNRADSYYHWGALNAFVTMDFA